MLTAVVSELVEGIENMQVLYTEKTTNGDGTADFYVTALMK